MKAERRESGFPGGSDSKASSCNVGDLGSVPVSGRFPGEGNGNPLQSSCLGNSLDRGEPGGLQSMGSQTDTTERLTVLLSPPCCPRDSQESSPAPLWCAFLSSGLEPPISSLPLL